MRNLLLVKLGAIGDAVMCLAAVQRFKDLHPDVRVTWVAGRTIAPLVEASEAVHRTLVVDEREVYGRLGRAEQARALPRLWGELRRESWDDVVLAYRDPRYRMLLGPLAARTVRSFRGRQAPVPGRYHGDEYFRLLMGRDGSWLERVDPAEVRLCLPLAPDLPSRPVALAPGGATNLLREDRLRRWPLENYASLARELTARGRSIVLVGAEGDRWVESAFEGGAIDSRIGRTSLLELVSLLRACDVVVTHDSGPLHLALLGGGRVVGLFGPTIPSEKVPPNRATILWGGEDLPCRPCYDGSRYADCVDPICLRSASVTRVLDALEGVDSKYPR